MAMIQKKNYILRHIFLIIVIVLVLFPLVWVVTTSIRRDNAAFSPKLFSSRITLNYYRDLLFPRATVPELIKDINGTAHFIGKNSQLSLEEANKKLNSELSDFNTYISQTNTYLSEIDSNFKNLLSSLEINKKDIIKDINKSRVSELKNLEEIEKSITSNVTIEKISVEINNLKNLISDYYKLRNEILIMLNKIPKTAKNEKYYQNTLSTIFSTSPKYILWKIKTYKKWLKIENNENILNLAPEVKKLTDKWNDILSNAKKLIHILKI
ncbi:hypothetical protein [Marinitoga lauensis]|uniref:hypothetical protein n=1 Tax=Marinitoga lauensis TaxID=2201189 RepID=UPI001011F76E|nr:hypothetical protein [Marinitoga lauensis]